MRKKIKILFILLFFVSALSFAQTLTVTDPHSGDTWNKGNTYTIRWTKSGSMNANVKIRLMQGGRKVLAITDSTANDGSYSWTVPSSVANGSYYIRVKTIDNAVYDDGEVFTISNAASSSPKITVTDPHSGDTWNKGNTYTIRWTKSGSMNANVKIRLMQGGTKVLAITDSTANDGSYSWTVPSSVANGSYYIRVKTIDNAVYDDGEVFTISNASSSKSLTVTYPNGGERIAAPGNIEIRWSSAGSISNVKIIGVGSTGNITVADSAPNTGSYTVSIPDSVNNGNYKIRIEDVSDSSVYDESDRTFTIYHPAGDPFIRITNPSGGGSLELGSREEIRWESGRFDGFVKIELWKDDGLSERMIGTITDRVKSSPFVWNVGGLMGGSASAGDNYYIVISSLNVPGLKAASGMFSIVSPPSPSPSGSITITAPFRGLKWYIGSPYEIRWNKRGDVGSRVGIKLMQGERKILTIVNITENDGVYYYTPTSDITPGIYHIRIESIDRSVSANSELFEIKEPVTTFEVRKPTSGDKWYKNQTYSIEWVKHGPARIDKVKIKLMQGNTQKYLITNSTENDGFYRWTIPDSINEGTYSIKVESLDRSVSGKSENFSIKRTYSGGTNNRFMSRRDNYNSSLKNLDFSIGHSYHPRWDLLIYEIKSSVPYTGKVNYVLFMESTWISRRKTEKITGEVNFNNESMKKVELNIGRYLPLSGNWCYKFIFIVNDKQAGTNLVSEKTKSNNSSESIKCDLNRGIIINDLKVRMYKSGEYYWKTVFSGTRGEVFEYKESDMDLAGNIPILIKGKMSNFNVYNGQITNCTVEVKGDSTATFPLNPQNFNLGPARYKEFTANAKGKFDSSGKIGVKIYCSYPSGRRAEFFNLYLRKK